MPKRTKSYESGLYERLRDPVYAKEYLRAALDDHEEGADAVFLLALRDIATANHMTYIAEATGLNRESLYKMLSRCGNPGINSLKAVLNAVGLELSVELARERPAVATLPEEDESVLQTQESPGDELVCAAVWNSGTHGAVSQYEVGLVTLANPPPRVDEGMKNYLGSYCFS